MLLSYHMVGAVSDGLVSRCRSTLLSVSVTGAASLHYQVIHGKVLCWTCCVCEGEVFGLAGTRLVLQQPNPDVGHLQLLLALYSEWIQRLPLGEGSIDDLLMKRRESFMAKNTHAAHVTTPFMLIGFCFVVMCAINFDLTP